MPSKTKKWLNESFTCFPIFLNILYVPEFDQTIFWSWGYYLHWINEVNISYTIKMSSYVIFDLNNFAFFIILCIFRIFLENCFYWSINYFNIFIFLIIILLFLFLKQFFFNLLVNTFSFPIDFIFKIFSHFFLCFII